MARGIDHLVLGTHDLDGQAELYRRLGFTVGARNRHAWGTLNHIVQFPGSFLELIATEPGFVRPRDDEPPARFAGQLADYLAKGDGLAMLVLEGTDSKAHQAEFGRRGIGLGAEPFFFERRGKRPDGSDVHVAFTLAFAESPAIRDAGFFVCQQHNPQAFWNPAFQAHANMVTGIAAVVMVTDTPQEQARFLAAFCGAERTCTVDGGEAADTGRGLIEAITPAALVRRYGEEALPATHAAPTFAAVRFKVGDLNAARGALARSGVPQRHVGPAIIVHPKAAHGVTLVFEG